MEFIALDSGVGLLDRVLIALQDLHECCAIIVEAHVDEQARDIVGRVEFAGMVQ